MEYSFGHPILTSTAATSLSLYDTQARFDKALFPQVHLTSQLYSQVKHEQQIQQQP